MSRKQRGRISRRQFLKAAGTALAAGALPALSCAPSEKTASAAGKTLRILQWSHFVPGYDALVRRRLHEGVGREERHSR